jgi:TonB family protein
VPRLRAASILAAFGLMAGVLPACRHHAVSTPSSDLRALHLRATTGRLGDDFVFVEPVDTGVRIRAIRVETASDWCPALVVQASERVVPDTTVQALAQAQVCAMTSERMEAAHRKAPYRRGLVDFIGSVEAVIAACGSRNKEFVRQMPPVVDDQLLLRQSPDVAALWDLLPRLRGLALGDSSYDPFASATADMQVQREALGTSLVPTLLAGPYGPYLSRLLTGYTGPPAQLEAVGEVLDREGLRLVEYKPPRTPQIALSARIFGDVRLRLRVDDASGSVLEVVVVEGTPLLATAATAAVKAWRFVPGAAAPDGVVVTVRFRRPC